MLIILSIYQIKLILNNQTEYTTKYNSSNKQFLQYIQTSLHRINYSFTKHMSTTTKKAIRRGRQKKQFMDEEDIQKQQQLEKAIEQGKVKSDPNDIFDTAKLDKNYFVRQQNKTSHHEAEIFNFDQQADTIVQLKQTSKKDESQSNIKKNISNKRREFRKRQKNQNIFDEEEQDEEEQIHKQIKLQQNTKESYPQQQIVQLQRIQKDKINQNQIKGQIQQSLKSPNKQNLNKSQKLDNEKSQGEQKQQDEFDNVIKQEADKQQDDQKIFILHKEIAKLSKQDKKSFYYDTIPQNHVAYAYFKRFSSGLSELYQLCGEDHRPLLFCQNQRGCIGANYYISMTKQMDKNNPSYIGKLRGNAAGSIYYLYDDGIQPKNELNRSDWRVSMAAIEYENNFMGMNGPRKLKVSTPSAKLLQDADTFKLSEQESLLSFQPPIISQFRNKTPKWNDKLKSYALNFGGRVKMASIKNFILIDNQFDIEDEDDSENIIVFGKIDENTFSMQYRYPLSLFQAFGIVMSQFDFKINCE